MLACPLLVNEETPEPLSEICLKYICACLDTISYADSSDPSMHHLLPGVVMPNEICERLLQVYQQEGNMVDDGFANLFINSVCMPLKRLKLRSSPLSNEGLKRLLVAHRFTELDLHICKKLSDDCLETLNVTSDQLLSLTVGQETEIFPPDLSEVIITMSEPSNVYKARGFILRAPKLRRLCIRTLKRERVYFMTLLRPLKSLTHLDLSSCEGLGQLDYLEEISNLMSLVLYNVQKIQPMIPAICKIKSLRHLDISQALERNGKFKDENQALMQLVQNLPNLESLDISGTNLAGTGAAVMQDDTSVGVSDIPGLKIRAFKPLEFLGLYGTMHGACHRHDIPAKRISGDANEEQILTAAAAYLDRPDILQKVLNDLYHLFRFESCRDLNMALTLVLGAMDRHRTEKHIQISGSATLFYIVKGKEKQVFVPHIKKRIVSTLLNAMGSHRDDDTMMRNGCLTLCQFKIPQDVLFEYQRLVEILLHIVSDMEQEGFVQRIGIYLLNSLACQVDGTQKQLLGDMGAMDRMLKIIEDRLQRRVCDDVLEVAWSTMWNVTDETAVNCQRFLEGGGMNLFLKCLNTFQEKEELLRNMMGLLGNVAEVKHLRPKLMTSEFVIVFANLLESNSDGIEVSYNAAGVLSHMASDGADKWTMSTPRRQDVLKGMVDAVEKWDLKTERNINYRSFEPILHLVNVYHTPECQHWAVWALANLTEVYANKYCQLVIEEGGIQLLAALLAHEAPYPRIKDLARRVIVKCREQFPNSAVFACLPKFLMQPTDK
ncbi:protein zer-1 homolog [Neocloeon triangulifer]|uniref:protein zer-1 homolog n=1 Tax=Neocloeon triangulifer TaxID=2078957 RepID=UPI00286EE80D|nr:protein zer-1 homolog [Neocloeon triangulifer]